MLIIMLHADDPSWKKYINIIWAVDGSLKATDGEWEFNKKHSTQELVKEEAHAIH